MFEEIMGGMFVLLRRMLEEFVGLLRGLLGNLRDLWVMFWSWKKVEDVVSWGEMKWLMWWNEWNNVGIWLD